MKSKILNLEFIRGLAALLVYLAHLKKYLPNLIDNNSFILQLFTSWGTECVMLFFLLSGIVVHYSFDIKSKSSLVFLKQRAIRLYPTLILALILSLVVEYNHFNNKPTFNTIIGNLIPYSTMQGYLAPLLWNTNPAIWSLTFEIFFYLVFGILIITDSKISYTKITLWLILSLFSIIYLYNPVSSALFNHIIIMLSYSTIWLIGFFIYRLRHSIYTDTTIALISTSLLPIISRLQLLPNFYDPIKYILFSITAGPLLILLLNQRSSYDNLIISKKYVFIFLIIVYCTSVVILVLDPSYRDTSKFLYVVLPALAYLCGRISSILNLLKKVISKLIIPFFGYFGKYSYSIYLIHMPLIVVFKNFKLEILYQIVIISLIIFLTSYIIENYIQPLVHRRLT